MPKWKSIQRRQQQYDFIEKIFIQFKDLSLKMTNSGIVMNGLNRMESHQVRRYTE